MGSPSYKSNEEMADDYIKNSKEAAKTLAEWGTRVNTFIQVGGEINGLEKALNSFKIFQFAGAASVLLGLMDGALQFYCIINKIPSKEELIFESLNNIQSSVTSLSKQLDSIYDQLVNEIQMDFARAEIANDVAYIDLWMKKVKEYTERSKDKPNELEHLEEEIFGKDNCECGNKQEKLELASQKLLKAATAKAPDSQHNLMETVYDKTYGDASAIITQGQYLINYAMEALYVYNFLSARMCDKKTPSEIESYMNGAREDAKDLCNNLNDISSSAQNQLSRCRNEWFQNVTRCIKEKFLDTASVNVKNPDTYQVLCNNILNTLKEYWNWSDWLVIVNEASNGWNEHGQARCGDFYQHRGKDDGGFGSPKQNIDVRIARADIIDPRTYDPVYTSNGEIIKTNEGINPAILATCQQVFESELRREHLNEAIKVDVQPALGKIWDSIKDNVEIFRICWWKKNTKYACTAPWRVWYYEPKIKLVDEHNYYKYYPYYVAIAFIKPRVLEMEQENWKYCCKCGCLAYNGFKESGACQAGSTHDRDPGHSWNYILSMHKDVHPPCQNNWRMCKKCYELVYNGFQDKGKCPAGGTHDLSASADYTIFIVNDPNAQGQPGWTWCDKCSALWWELSGPKPCPKGEYHNSSGKVILNHWTNTTAH